MARGSWSWVSPFTQVGLGFDKIPVGRLSSGKMTSPGGRPCKEQHALLYFRRVLFLAPAGNVRGFVLGVHWEDLVELMVVKLTKLCCRGFAGLQTPGACNSEPRPYGASSNSSVPVRVFLP